MAVTASAGYPQLSGSTVPDIIYSTRTLEKFYLSTIFSEICNTDYEGDITKMGDKVRVRTIPSATVSDYQKGDNINYEALEHGTVDLEINKAKYYAIAIDDIDRFQTDLNAMEDFTSDAARQLDIAVDYSVLNNVSTDIDSNNKGTTAGVDSNDINLGTTSAAVPLDKYNIVDYIVDLATVLDEQNVPEEDRYLVMPPWACNLLTGKSDLKAANLTGDSKSTLRTKVAGEIFGFTVLRSRQLPYVAADTAWKMFAGHKKAISFAAQITEHETLRAQSTFANYARELMVYGFKVMEGEWVAELYASKG